MSATGSPEPTPRARSRRTGLAFDPADALPKTLRSARRTLDAASRNCARATTQPGEGARGGRGGAHGLGGRPGGARGGDRARCAPRSPRSRRPNEAVPDTHDYDEAQTRDLFIDLLLARGRLGARPDARPRIPRRRHAEPDGRGLRRLRAVGRRRQAAGAGRGQAHAAGTRASGQQQAKLYADCLEAQFGQRPVIFYTNGYEHWIWDDTRYPPRQVQGFYKRDELELLIQRRAAAGSRSTRKTINTQDRRAPLPDTRDPRDRRGLRAGRPAQGAAGHGDRLGQDAHRDRAGRPADAGQLGQARAVPRRPRGAGEPGGRRLQGAPAATPRRSTSSTDKNDTKAACSSRPIRR